MNYFLAISALLVSFASAAHFIEPELKVSALKGTNFIIGRLQHTLSLLDTDPIAALVETYTKYDEDSLLLPVHEVPSIDFLYTDMLQKASEAEKGELLVSAHGYTNALLTAYERVQELINGDSFAPDNFESLIREHKVSVCKQEKASKALNELIESLKNFRSLVGHALPEVKVDFTAARMTNSFELLKLEAEYSAILKALNDADNDRAYDLFEECINELEQVKCAVDTGTVEYAALYHCLKLGDFYKIRLIISDAVLDFPESAQFYNTYAFVPISFEDTEFIKNLFEELILNLKFLLNEIESNSPENVLLHSHFIFHRNLMSQSLVPRDVFVAIIQSDLKKPKMFASLTKTLLTESYENAINCFHGYLLSIEHLKTGEKFTVDRDIF